MSVVLSSSHGDKRLHVDDDGQVEDDEAHLLRRMTVMVILILTTVVTAMHKVWWTDQGHFSMKLEREAKGRDN